MHITHARIYYVRYTYIRLKWYYYHCAVQVFQKGRPVLPTLQTCGEQANTKSLRESMGESTGKKAVMPRGKYNSYTQKQYGYGC